MKKSGAEKQLTGRHVLITLLAFFGVMLAVNAYFTVVAVKTFRGEDVPRSYRQGLEYNQTINARDMQVKKGWSASVNVLPQGDAARVVVKIVDEQGNPVPNLQLQGKVRHPTDTTLDRPVIFQWDGTEHYTASLNVSEGRWKLVANARKLSDIFSFEYDIWLS